MSDLNWIHVVIPGSAPPAPRPRATLIPTMRTQQLLNRARTARTARDLMDLFRPQIYSAAKGSDVEIWKRQAGWELKAAKSRLGYAIGSMIGLSTQPIEVWILVVCKLPKSRHRKTLEVPRAWQMSRSGGDFDNLAKPVCDVATGILWDDDCQIVRATVEKIVAAQGEEPRLEIIARPVQDSPSWTRFEEERSALRQENARL